MYGHPGRQDPGSQPTSQYVAIGSVNVQPPPLGARLGAQRPPIRLERSFPCVKLRGIPYDAVEDDIPAFLGIELVDILFVKQSDRFTGEAFVVLPSLGLVELALGKNKSYLGRRYVEVFRASKLDYYKAVNNEMLSGFPAARPPQLLVQQQQGSIGSPGGPRRKHDALTAPGYAPEGVSTVIAKLRGLPWAVRKDDIVNWFSDLPIQPIDMGMVHVVLEGGRPTGIAYVEFHSARDALAALIKDKQMMGQRYVEVFGSNREEAARYMPREQASAAPLQLQ